MVRPSQGDRTRPGALLRALCLCAIGLAVPARSQTHHELRLGREAAFTGAGLVFHGVGLLKHEQNRSRPLPVIDHARLPSIDRVATRQWSTSADRASDLLFGMATVASLSLAIVNQHGEQPLMPAVIIAESGMFAAGLTHTVKEFVRRPRPYLYNRAVPASAYHPGDDALSFWSGHTANVAAITFSTAMLVQRSEASPGSKRAMWIGAAITPAAMGYLRVRAGRHFPTDVLTGYLVGAAVGLAVPYFHRTSK